MRNGSPYKSSLTYMMAAVMTAAPAFHIGDTIEIETLLNGRSDKNFLSDQESIKRYVLTQLPKGTLGKIEKIQPFKKTGNTGLYITITSGPNAGKKYWVLNRLGRHYLKLYDNKSKETESVQDAEKLETQQDISAIHDRQPAEAPSDVDEAAIPKRVLDFSLYVKSAGESPKADCQNAPSPQAESASAVTPPSIETPLPTPKLDLPALSLSRETAAFYLRSTDYAQSDKPQIQSLAMRITDGKTDDLSKALEIHDWVAANVNYDTDAYFKEYLQKQRFSRQYDALAVLNRPEHTAICNGYANVTIALLRAANIPARQVQGFAHYNRSTPNNSCQDFDKDFSYNPQRHAWVEAWVNGQWLAMDTSADAGFTDFTQEKFTSSPSRRYMDPEAFKASHTPCIIDNTY